MTRRQFRMFEFFLVAAVIGVIALMGISRYLDLGRETRRIGFELLSHHFTTAVANARVHWLIQGVQGGSREFLEGDGAHLYMSPAGWPASTENKITSVPQDLTPDDCLDLWFELLQNPMQASLEGKEPRGERRYHISLLERGICRYELVTREYNSHYFDYSPADGRVSLRVPTNEKIPDL